MRGLQGRSAALLAIAILAAGCVGALDPESPAATSGLSGASVWETGLASTATTPEIAATRSAEERRSDVSPPGDPAFAAFDSSIEAWMARYEIPTGQVALMHAGKLRYERGFGHLDEGATKPADALTMFRIASVTKPMTGAVATMQVEQGLYNWSDPVFCIEPDPAPACRLRIAPHPARPIVDERLREITVAQLLDHTAGWGRPADKHLLGEGVIAIADALGIPTPPPAWRTAQFMLGEELSYDPGSNGEYCNTCYLMLGLVAESASGASLPALYDAYLFRPLEIVGDIEPGHTRIEERNAREPFYYCEGGDWGNIYEPGTPVCPADGAVDLDAMLAVGGMISTASAAVAVYEVYESVFSEEYGPLHLNGHSGGLPGTATFVGTVEGTPVGEVQYAVFFNRANYDDPANVAMTVYHLETAIAALAIGWGAAEEASPASEAARIE